MPLAAVCKTSPVRGTQQAARKAPWDQRAKSLEKRPLEWRPSPTRRTRTKSVNTIRECAMRGSRSQTGVSSCLYRTCSSLANEAPGRSMSVLEPSFSLLSAYAPMPASFARLCDLALGVFDVALNYNAAIGLRLGWALRERRQFSKASSITVFSLLTRLVERND